VHRIAHAKSCADFPFQDSLPKLIRGSQIADQCKRETEKGDHRCICRYIHRVHDDCLQSMYAGGTAHVRTCPLRICSTSRHASMMPSVCFYAAMLRKYQGRPYDTRRKPAALMWIWRGWSAVSPVSSHLSFSLHHHDDAMTTPTNRVRILLPSPKMFSSFGT